MIGHQSIGGLLTRTRRARLVVPGDVAIPVAIAVVSRVFSSATIAWRAMTTGTRLPGLTSDHSPFAAWDGQWYLRIALTGYHAAAVQPGPNGGHHDFAFYPGWPLLLRLVSLAGIPIAPASVVLANVLFVAASVLLFGVFAVRFGHAAAAGGVALLAFSPPAYVFSMAYSEPLFLLLAALYFARPGSRLRPVFAGLAMLVRITGLAIAASAAVMWATRFASARHLRGSDGGGRSLAWVLAAAAPLAAFALWWIFIWHLTGRFTGWFMGSASWERVVGMQAIVRAIPHLTALRVLWLGFVGLMVGASLLLFQRQLELGVYSIAAIGMSLVGAPIGSMPRHAMMAFPAFGLLAERLGRRGTVILAVIFALAQVAFVAGVFGPTREAP